MNNNPETDAKFLLQYSLIKKKNYTVDFSVLLRRMECIGIKGLCLKLFESYLNGRLINVMIDDVTPSRFHVTCGIPQGSVLGLLLYLIYVDRMRFHLSDSCLTSFADDTALRFSIQWLNSLGLKVNRVLKSFHVFTNLSLLYVNIAKTSFVLHSRVSEPQGIDG